MTWVTDRLRQLLRDESGASFVIMSLIFFTVVGFTALAVDVGAWITTKSQLQNASDAAALAAANTMVVPDSAGNAVAQPVVSLQTATTYSKKNIALGVALDLAQPGATATQGDDFLIGFWDVSKNDFDYSKIGIGLTNPDDITAVRVRLRRDDVQNTPIPALFSRIWGWSSVNVSAQSTALLGWAGSGQADVPLAVPQHKIAGQSGALCGTQLIWHPTGQSTDNGYWWGPVGEGHSDNTLRPYVTGQEELPDLTAWVEGQPNTVNNSIDLTNGVAANLFSRLADRFAASVNYDTNNDGINDAWVVHVPVFDANDGVSGATGVRGFATVLIRQVQGPPDNNIIGDLMCGMSMANSTTQGTVPTGTRATISKLIN